MYTSIYDETIEPVETAPKELTLDEIQEKIELEEFRLGLLAEH